MTEITHCHALSRRVLWPIYSADQAILTVAVIGAIAALFALLDSRAAPFVTVGSIIVVWILNYRHSPIRVRIPRSVRANAVEILDEYWMRTGRTECWVPRAARWRRWGFIEICITDTDNEIIITGPQTNVLPLISDLGLG